MEYNATGGTPETLAAEIQRLMHDEQAYNEAMSWRQMRFEELSPGSGTEDWGWLNHVSIGQVSIGSNSHRSTGRTVILGDLFGSNRHQ